MAINSQVEILRVMLFPKDFIAVKRFYSEVIGWPITHQWDMGEADRGVMFDSGCGTFELLSWQHSHAQDGYLPVQGCGCSLGVANVWALWDELKDQPAILFGLKSFPWGNDAFGIADPEGFQLIFFSDTARRSLT